ncbi:competence/damage-inducible protein A [Salisediminibacterium halotolerans]|uniref:competence/damage-inducible protein A n=1 Tax=Salisediminibacterium halotolerans TaxID=517425 RepID=UPI000EABE33C|nr:competence/damage-inducible protein A [Salisediminibacterium halotolerans]RLJ74157.1 competence/damage-inducible protein cinA [Actinophytocola xinjiangensis]RPE87750.1 competence/damage-inducible protein cinA [Salisediminibacterium halotolerans]TWG34994.1 competence/damage-inducible protein cinA [Salisediminibacterium halotolerans]GEL06719.1 putative competence-damage inducible protein [Salisediminibacterium halotolerans]
MNAEIIAVGSELLLGQIENSNAAYLSKELTTLGINVYHHITVGDNPDRLQAAVESAAERADLLIFTGGLGPTKDDLTKETVAKVTGSPLIYDDETEQRILAYYAKRGQTMTVNNRKQALILEGADVFPNDHGMACGMSLKTDKAQWIMLPGPPKELQPMVEDYVMPYLRRELYTNEKIESKILRFFDIGESKIAEELDDLIENQTNPTIAPLASEGEIKIRLTVKGDDPAENGRLLEEMKTEVLSRIGKYFYGEGEKDLRELVNDRLRASNQTIASAESLTGGLFAETLTSLSGASDVFPGGVVCYSNAVKENVLSVPRKLLDEHGAVSGACAARLAENVRKLMDVDIGISFTGVAGPDPLEGHEPGVVFMAISQIDDTTVIPLNLAGSRRNISGRTVKYGCFHLLKILEKQREKDG